MIADRNVYLHSYLKSNPVLTVNVHIDKTIISPLEELTDIPDNSVDAVVGTYVLCSVADVDKILKEIKRVLSHVS